MKAMPRCRRQRRPQPQTHLQFLRREWFSVASVVVKVIYIWGIDIWLDTAQWPVAKRRSPLEMAAGDSG